MVYFLGAAILPKKAPRKNKEERKFLLGATFLTFPHSLPSNNPNSKMDGLQIDRWEKSNNSPHPSRVQAVYCISRITSILIISAVLYLRLAQWINGLHMCKFNKYFDVLRWKIMSQIAGSMWSNTQWCILMKYLVSFVKIFGTGISMSLKSQIHSSVYWISMRRGIPTCKAGQGQDVTSRGRRPFNVESGTTCMDTFYLCCMDSSRHVRHSSWILAAVLDTSSSSSWTLLVFFNIIFQDD